MFGKERVFFSGQGTFFNSYAGDGERSCIRPERGDKGRKKVNTIREWISDNLRYILLLLAILAVALAAFFAIRFLRGRNGGATDAEEESISAETAVTETPATAAEAPKTAEDRALSDAPEEEVVALVNRYYTALGAQDVAALRETLDELSDDDAARFVTSIPITYSDVKAYVKPGPDPSSRVAYVYYHYLEEGAEKALPGLSSLFLTKNASGSYVIKTTPLTAQEEAYMQDAATDPDIQELISTVKSEFDAASAQPAESGPEETAAPEESSEASEVSEAEGGTSRILQDCNVRAGAGYNYNSIGVITEGTEVTIIGERGKGWTHIRGGGFDGYVGTTFLE